MELTEASLFDIRSELVRRAEAMGTPGELPPRRWTLQHRLHNAAHELFEIWWLLDATATAAGANGEPTVGGEA